MVADFETSARAKGEPTKRDLAIIAFLKTYAVPYFTKNKITDINPKEIAKFFDWRRANSKRKAPKETTILHETSQFSTFLRWCHRRGHLDREIRIERPKQDGVRRPHFDAVDWRRLTRFLREWVKQGEHKSGPIYRDRVMLANYVLILANTGVRVGEARGLRWRDVESEPTNDPDKVNIIVHVKGKTGSREVVARTPEIQTYFRRIWDLRCEEMERRDAVEGRLRLLSQGRDADPLVQEGLHDAAGGGRGREGPRGGAADDLLAAAHLRHVPPARGCQPLRPRPQHGHVGEDAGAVLRPRVDPCDGERTDQEPGEGEEDAAVGVSGEAVVAGQKPALRRDHYQ